MGQLRASTGDDDGDFLSRLPKELGRWERDGIITGEQGRAILDSYPPSKLTPTGVRARGRLVTGLSVVGSVLVGLGVILFFATNWDGIDRGTKLGVILAATIAAYSLGYYLRYHRGYQRVGGAVILLGCLVYGAAVHLVGQVYNVELNDPDLMLFWFLGVIPLVYIVRSQPIQFLGVVLFLATVGFRLGDWLEAVSRGDMLLGAALFLILGLMLLALGRIKEELRLLRPLAEVFQLGGLLTALGALYVLSFKDVYWSFEKGTYIQGEVAVGYWVLAAAGGALALVLTAATAWLRWRRADKVDVNLTEGTATAVLLAAAYIVATVDAGGDVLYAVVFNALLALSLLGVLVTGYLRGRETWVNIGLAFISLTVISRYFEYSWSLLDRSIIFVTAGAILLVGGFLVERGRRKMLEGIRIGEGTQ